ncbi:bifunctional hydroxymethylpyrimidine kinase/phosphomethylpyrimidine kinase [Paroceanicella profunda]|uniref:hydroxymethylpyrimidine kinase n=1 Tax=Paroceanicella profunda TaxID=2579971 RepID=A0A5B8FI33_9RHOB|nr:bifunctional hydroxymethylpyrimidine kinase/phosphomethylpyrimidine kinase [Paroceanicella profunda]QDL92887.1 bifunctional hydroxymethylpyrimidine kinase/phosphomethylpyrimidine kinase [Paroceanicella profunda]
MIPNILSIAGSDPSGGAGIQADIKAISANGGYAMAALTALTVQNTRGVSGVSLVEPGFVAAQIDAIFADICVDAVKIGMIGSADIAAAVARSLRGRAVQVVLDPVMIAKSGDPLLQADAVETLRRELLPLATMLTPNLPEAAALLGRDTPILRGDMPEVAAALRGLGPRAVLVKGGHLDAEETSPDLLDTGDGHTWLDGPRHATRNTHGTGCTLSSALATQMALQADVQAAARTAKAYVAAAIAGADRLSVGGGHGPTHHFHAFQAG